MNESSSPLSTQFIKLVGSNIKVPVRSAPTAEGKRLKYLHPDDVVEVKVMNSKGFYRLADDSVMTFTFYFSLVNCCFPLLFDHVY